MVFGQPDAVHPHALRLVHQLEGLAEDFSLGDAFMAGEFVEQSELHHAASLLMPEVETLEAPPEQSPQAARIAGILPGLPTAAAL